MKSHAAVSSELLGDDLVGSVLRDFETSPLEEGEKALLRFVGQVTKDLPAVTLADIDQLRSAGWNDEAIFYTITVCALFNFYNRWITASGVHAVSDEGHRLHGRVLAQKGYDARLREQHFENTNKG
jgi:alkylhydroperoxidase family enzyme